MSTVGIIANPASGKDIRRLVTYGSTFDNQEKVRIVRRVLSGLAAMQIDRVCYMQDSYGIVDRALRQMENIAIPVDPLPLRISGDQEDSIQAARMMAEQQTDCIVTLGGDGTNRVVVKGTTEVPILPISTGTNNVFSVMIEGTLAGIAAGLIAKKRVPLDEGTWRSTLLEVLLDGRVTDLALVDAAVYDDVFIGSRAVWDMTKVRQLFLNRAEPQSIGLSSIGGLLHPVAANSPQGLHLELGNSGKTVTAPVAPGMIQPVSISKKSVMSVGENLPIRFAPCVLALDGEREIEIRKGRDVAIRLAERGPIVVDAGRTMAAAARRGLFNNMAKPPSDADPSE